MSNAPTPTAARSRPETREEMKHISQIEDRAAGHLANKDVLKRDTYHDTIADAALVLCTYKSDLDNFLAVCTYAGQWSSGTTLWMHPDGGTVAVSIGGHLDISGIPEPSYGGSEMLKPREGDYGGHKHGWTGSA